MYFHILFIYSKPPALSDSPLLTNTRLLKTATIFTTNKETKKKHFKKKSLNRLSTKNTVGSAT